MIDVLFPNGSPWTWRPDARLPKARQTAKEYFSNLAHFWNGGQFCALISNLNKYENKKLAETNLARHANCPARSSSQIHMERVLQAGPEALLVDKELARHAFLARNVRAAHAARKAQLAIADRPAAIGQGPSGGGGKAAGKGKKAWHQKTAEGIEICYAFNNNKTCKQSPCNRAHVCQICLSNEHGRLDCPDKDKA